MTNTDQALDIVRDVLREVRSRTLSKLSGVPYTTLLEASKRGFSGMSVDTLRKLEIAARGYRNSNPRKAKAV